ncbi:MAG TPA: NADH-quinone oxidoreductase subunit N [Geobacteraceae bacterium]|nr:NADH-quinone oxidoreductase subunit N [Geobacteraceae bacterium]
MTTAELWTVMPLAILACGALVILIFGAVAPGRHGTAVGACFLLGAALWCLQQPPSTATSSLGLALTPFARFFMVFFSLTALLVLLLSHDYNERRGVAGEEYPATILFTVFGMGVLSASVNLLTLFLGLEGMTFGFYFLVAIDRTRPESGEAGMKYLLMGAVAAAFTAFGIALVYAGVGTLEIGAAMKALSAMGKGNPVLIAGAGFLLAGIAFKVSLVPAHLWTPDVYEGAPAPVVAFLSTASKGSAVAFLLLLLAAAGGAGPLRTPIWMLSLLSMVTGNLAALLQTNLKRMLAYSAIAQMGYIALALIVIGEGGFGAAAFYVVAYTAMNLAAFGVIASLTGGSEPAALEDYRGLGYSRPFQGGVMALAMFALAGIPPTAGFIGKFFIFAAAIRGGEVALAVIGILTAVVSVYYYLRVVVNLYMRPADTGRAPASGTLPEYVALACAAMVILFLGIFPGPLAELIDLISR